MKILNVDDRVEYRATNGGPLQRGVVIHVVGGADPRRVVVQRDAGGWITYTRRKDGNWYRRGDRMHLGRQLTKEKERAARPAARAVRADE